MTLVNKHTKIPQQGKYGEDAVEERRKWLEDLIGLRCKYVQGHWKESGMDPACFEGNTENLIGFAKVPLGLVGPLLFNGTHVQGHVLCPFATTEGGLVAGINRGCKAVTMSGGFRTYARQMSMTRAPVFVTCNPAEAHHLEGWLETLVPRLQDDVVSKRTKHGIINRILCFSDMEKVSAVFIYTTGDAAGQNLTTDATQACLDWIKIKCPVELPEVTIKVAYIEGGLGGDKHTSQLAGLLGRGAMVSATCNLTESSIKNILRTTPEHLTTYINTYLSIVKRESGANHSFANANILAGIFTATGQDIACVHESSTSYLYVKLAKDAKGGIGMQVDLHMPSLVIGTVGGGTGLPSQKECLEILGCSGEGKVQKLAEIIAGFCLAHDISLAASLCTGEFAHGQNVLGRNRPKARL